MCEIIKVTDRLPEPGIIVLGFAWNNGFDAANEGHWGDESLPGRWVCEFAIVKTWDTSKLRWESDGDTLIPDSWGLPSRWAVIPSPGGSVSIDK